MVARTHVTPTRVVWFVGVLGLLTWTAPIAGGDPKPDVASPSSDLAIPSFDLAIPSSDESVVPELFKLDAAASDGSEIDVASKESAFNEIKQIQQRLGGSVLQGSTLMNESSEPLANFDTHVREQLGLPPLKVTPDTNSEDQTSLKLGFLDGKRPESKLVRTVREQVTKLDSIANDIESLRAYAQADELRETAKKLRLIARELDAER